MYTSTSALSAAASIRRAPPDRSHPNDTSSVRAALDELKTHQRGPRAVLRSKSPELVLQENVAASRC